MIKFIFTLFFFVPVYIFQFINAEQLTNKKYEIKKELFIKNHNDLNSEINLLVNEIFSLITKDNNKAFNKANFALQKLKKSDPNFEFVGLYYQIYNLLGLLYRNKEDFKNSESFF